MTKKMPNVVTIPLLLKFMKLTIMDLFNYGVNSKQISLIVESNEHMER